MYKYAHKKMKYIYEIMSRVRLEKYKIRPLKLIVLPLNCILGPPNLGVRGTGPSWIRWCDYDHISLTFNDLLCNKDFDHHQLQPTGEHKGEHNGRNSKNVNPHKFLPGFGRIR